MTEMTELAVGTKAPEREFGPMTPQMFVRYSGASGDLNPMHYDADFARKAGYPSVFSQGMHQAALLSTFATDWLGPQYLRRFLVRFRDQVWPNDILTCRGVITEVKRVGDRQLVMADLTCLRQTGAIAISGEADFLLPI
jgi:acyl dehydratase